MFVRSVGYGTHMIDIFKIGIKSFESNVASIIFIVVMIRPK